MRCLAGQVFLSLLRSNLAACVQVVIKKNLPQLCVLIQPIQLTELYISETRSGHIFLNQCILTENYRLCVSLCWRWWWAATGDPGWWWYPGRRMSPQWWWGFQSGWSLGVGLCASWSPQYFDSIRFIYIAVIHSRCHLKALYKKSHFNTNILICLKVSI